MERNRLKTGDVNEGRPVVLFLNQDKARVKAEKMTGQCSSLCKFTGLDANMVSAGKELCMNTDRDVVNELTIVLLAGRYGVARLKNHSKTVKTLYMDYYGFNQEQIEEIIEYILDLQESANDDANVRVICFVLYNIHFYADGSMVPVYGSVCYGYGGAV